MVDLSLPRPAVPTGGLTITPEQFGKAGQGSAYADTIALERAAAASQRGCRLLLTGTYRPFRPICIAASDLTIEWTPGAAIYVNHLGDALVVGRRRGEGARSERVNLIRPTIIQSAQGATTGAGIRCCQITVLNVIGPYIRGVRDGLVFGEDGAIDDIRQLNVDAPSLSPGGGRSMRFLSGSIADVVGGKHNGKNADDMEAVQFGGDLSNWDGLNLYGGVFEQWDCHVRSGLAGGGNANFSGGQHDRAKTRGFDLCPGPNGSIKHVTIAPFALLDREAASPPDPAVDASTNESVGVYASSELGGVVDDVRISGKIEGMGKQGVYFRGSRLMVNGAEISNCGGQDPGSYTSVDVEASMFAAAGNTISGPYHRSGIKAAGPGQRKTNAEIAAMNTIFAPVAVED